MAEYNLYRLRHDAYVINECMMNHAFRFLFALVVVTCIGAWHTAEAFAENSVQMWLTTADGTKKLSQERDIAITTIADTNADTIIVDPGKRYQTIAGFGAALTDSSAWLIKQKLNDEQRKSLLTDLFSANTGIGLSAIRLTVGASDYSLEHYTYDDMPSGMRDPNLTNFSIIKARDAVLPVLKQALTIEPDLNVFATPWSAPAWMKTNGRLIGGKLAENSFAIYAQYLSRYVTAMKAEGVSIYAITVQNEPGFVPTDYPGMLVSPEARAKFIAENIGPLFAARHADTRVLDWDHNWDDPQSPLDVLGHKTAEKYISGVAWHCYAGDVSAQSVVHERYPDKETYLTECSGGEWAPQWAGNLDWMVRNLIIDAARNWSSGTIMWNLALDESHGPHSGGCTDCRGVVTIDSKTGSVHRNIEYYVLAHASRFVRPRAVRIDSGNPFNELDHVAFRNSDGSLALIVFNFGKTSNRFSVRQGTQYFTATLPAGALATFLWQ